MKKIAGILKILLVVSLLIGSIGSDVVLADSFETNSINVVGAKASNQIELGTIGAWFDSVPMMSAKILQTVKEKATQELGSKDSRKWVLCPWFGTFQGML